MKSIVPIGRSLTGAAAIGLTLLALLGVFASGAAASQGPTLRLFPDDSSQRAEVEATIARMGVVAKLKAALGDAYGGVWFDGPAAQLHVGVTSPQASRAAETVAVEVGLGANVTETLVRSSWAALELAQARLNHGLGDLLGRSEAATSLAPERNSVEVELGSAVPAPRRAEVAREASVAGVTVEISTAVESRFGIKRLARCNAFAENKAYCNPTIVAGVTIEAEDGETCTAGPAVTLKDKSIPAAATATYILTAGHCLEFAGGPGVKWYAYNKKEETGGEKKKIGEAGAYLNESLDVGVIWVENPGYWAAKGNVPVNPTIAPWEEKEPEPFNVGGEVESVEGLESCYSGQTSGTHCGTVKQVNLTVGKSEHLVEMEGVAGAEGDSGGPWFSKNSPSIVEGTMVGERKKTGNLVFQMLNWSLKELAKYELLTKEDEARHPFTFAAESAPVTLTGGNDGSTHIFKTTAGSVECKGATFSGTQAEKEVVELELTPTYSECATSGIAVSINANGCVYRFTAIKVEGGTRKGNMDIVCPAGKEITASWSLFGTNKCTIKVPPQEGLNITSYTNVGTGATRETTFDIAITGFKYTHTAGTGFISCTTGSAQNGTYEGKALLTGETDAGATHVGFFVS